MRQGRVAHGLPVVLPAGGRLARISGAAAAALVLVAAGGVTEYLHSRPLMHVSFGGPDGLIANEYAYNHPHDPRATTSPTWLVTSGSLFRRNGTAWTGHPDQTAPGPTSRTGTDSDVFRMVSRRTFDDASVAFRLRVGAAQPGNDAGWTGVHVFLRYQDEFSLYAVSVDRRDGVIAVKKKVAGGQSNGGTYYTLAQGHHVLTKNAWHDIRTSVRNVGADVVIDLSIDGHTLLQARDTGVGGPPLTSAGRVGIRGDFTDFQFDNFTVDRA